MNGLVSGRAGRALIIDGDALQSFDIDDTSRLIPRSQTDLQFLLGEARDLRILEDTSIEAVTEELQADYNFTLALDLTLISLDAELENDIREEALEGLEELLANAATVERLENVLYSSPLPEDADLAGALQLSEPAVSGLASQFLRRLEEHQSSIAQVDQAWNTIPSKNFNNDEAREVFRRVAVTEGLFRTLATTDSSASLSTFLLKAGLNQSILKLPNYRQVIQAWVTPFRHLREAPRILEEEEDVSKKHERLGKRGKIDRKAVLQEAIKRKSAIVGAMRRRDLERVYNLVDELIAYHQSYSESQHTAKSLCDLAMEAKALDITSLQLALTERSLNIAPGDGWSWTQHADALLQLNRLDEALQASDQAIAFGGGVVAKNTRAEILKAKRQFDDALAGFDEVISEDPENSFAKTGRAEVLKAQGRFDAALTAYSEVIRLHPENGVVRTGRAEVLKAQGQFDAALAAFDEVIDLHPKDVVAKNGRAEVLKAQGQFAAALSAYDEVIALHPEDVVAKAGRAEVLKAQGNFAAALSAYEEAIRLHPESVVVKRGRAEVLKTQGQFAAALSAYEEVIRLHPQDVVAKNGRAEVLKAQGQLTAALAAYDELLREHPQNSFASNGRSCVLVDLHRYQEAIDALPNTVPITVDDWIVFHIRGMILLRMGDTREAIKIFSQGLEKSPFASTKQHFRGALGLSWLRGREFKKAAETLEAVTSPELQPSANVIRIHVFGAQGERRRALDAYENLATTPYLLNDELTQELHHQYVLGGEPRKDDEWVFDREVRIFLRAA